LQEGCKSAKYSRRFGESSGGIPAKLKVELW
jgi:hypothetical protein